MSAALTPTAALTPRRRAGTGFGFGDGLGGGGGGASGAGAATGGGATKPAASRSRLDMLERVPILSALTPTQMDLFLGLAREDVLPPGHFFVRTGDLVEELVVVESGQAKQFYPDTAQPGSSPSSDTGLVSMLGPGAVFGQHSVVAQTAIVARYSVVCVETVKCLRLWRDDFITILSDVTALLNGSPDKLMDGDDPEIASLSRHLQAFNASVMESGNPMMASFMSAFSPELHAVDVVTRVVESVKVALSARDAFVFVVDSASNELVAHMSKDQRYPIAGMAQDAILGRRLVCVQDCSADVRYSASTLGVQYTPGPMICCPIMATVAGRVSVIGLLQACNAKGNMEFREHHREVVSLVCDLLSDTILKLPSEQSLDASEHFTAIRKVETPLCIQIARLEQLKIGRKPGLFGSESVSIAVGLFYGNTALCPPVNTPWLRITPGMLKTTGTGEGSTTLADIGVVDTVAELGIAMKNIPRAARIIFTVSLRSGPIAWAGCVISEFNGMFRSGHVRLALWFGDCPSPTATTLDSRHHDPAGTLEIQFESFHPRPVVFTSYGELPTSDLVASVRLSKRPLPAELEDIMLYDPLHEMSESDKDTLWRHRYLLCHYPEAITKFLRSINWADSSCVREAHQLLHLWNPPGPLEALQMLDSHFPDPKMRAFAVACLEGLTDEQLEVYMLQLVQVLKYEPFHDSSLARFLLRRSLVNTHILGHVLFWHLKSEMHNVDAAMRFGVIMVQYLRLCGEHRLDLGKQLYVLSHVDRVAMQVKTRKSRGGQVESARLGLSKIIFPERFFLPIDPTIEVSGLVLDRCRVMTSKKLPLMLVFRTSKEFQLSGRSSSPEDAAMGMGSASLEAAPLKPATYTVMYKNGDDLRQDQLTLQLLSIMDLLWKKDGMDMKMSPYKCVSTGYMAGMLEIVLDSATIAHVVELSIGEGNSTGVMKKLKAARAVAKDDVILRWLADQSAAIAKDAPTSLLPLGDGSGLPRFGHKRQLAIAQDNFARSCAGYCVATYLMGIGDRHSDNIMITKTGKLFHIDFGHFLGNFKSKYGMKRERTEFVFTPQFAGVLGPVDSPAFRSFVDLACRAYNILRQHGDLFITLFSLMVTSGIPQLRTVSDIQWVRDKLLLNATATQAASVFHDLIFEAMGTKATQVNDMFHMLRHVR